MGRTLRPSKFLLGVALFTAGYGIGHFQFRLQKRELENRMDISHHQTQGETLTGVTPSMAKLLSAARPSSLGNVPASKLPQYADDKPRASPPGCDSRRNPVCAGVSARETRSEFVEYWRTFIENEDEFARALSEAEENDSGLPWKTQGAIAVQRAIYAEYIASKNSGRKLSPPEMAALADRFEAIGASSEEGDVFYGVLDHHHKGD